MISAPGLAEHQVAKNIVTLPPGTITTWSGSTSTPVPPLQVGRHRLAQRQDAVGRRIAVMPVAQRLHRGLDDMSGVRKSGCPMPN